MAAVKPRRMVTLPPLFSATLSALFRGATMKTKNAFLACGLAALSWSAQALQIISLSPQGEVAQVRQLVAKFDESAVNFGDPKAEAPLYPELQ